MMHAADLFSQAIESSDSEQALSEAAPWIEELGVSFTKQHAGAIVVDRTPSDDHNQSDANDRLGQRSHRGNKLLFHGDTVSMSC